MLLAVLRMCSAGVSSMLMITLACVVGSWIETALESGAVLLESGSIVRVRCLNPCSRSQSWCSWISIRVQ